MRIVTIGGTDTIGFVPGLMDVYELRNVAGQESPGFTAGTIKKRLAPGLFLKQAEEVYAKVRSNETLTIKL